MKQRQNDLYYADTAHLLGVTSDKRLMRNIKRSTKADTWRIIGEQRKASGKILAVKYLIPAKDKRQAERRFNVEARKLA
ncbi:hypothetical protein [Virgibacillus dakarensis]|uniref:hypothetical protein n=1 Tax=Virgibacillus dakarensis TaxID=1917889 RepID=UPI000B453E1C|nr:hypothetical protein [Virgibacillus dakarensis]